MAHQTDKSRTEDLTTDQRAARHPSKSANYTEEAQGVLDDNVAPDVQPLADEDREHARNKANESRKD